MNPAMLSGGGASGPSITPAPEGASFLDTALGLHSLSLEHFGEILLRLSVAGLLAAVLAFRPWRRIMGMKALKNETAQAQVMIAISGALMVAIIGDSTARAFGLVGLGGFIRFRSGIKDPRDAAVMFVMIGVGMACGIGEVPLASMATAFAALLLLAFDVWGTATPERSEVTFIVDNALTALPALRATWPRGRVIVAPVTDESGAKIVLELDLAELEDAASLYAKASAAGVPGIREVGITDD